MPNQNPTQTTDDPESAIKSNIIKAPKIPNIATKIGSKIVSAFKSQKLKHIKPQDCNKFVKQKQDDFDKIFKNNPETLKLSKQYQRLQNRFETKRDIYLLGQKEYNNWDRYFFVVPLLIISGFTTVVPIIFSDQQSTFISTILAGLTTILVGLQAKLEWNKLSQKYSDISQKYEILAKDVKAKAKLELKFEEPNAAAAAAFSNIDSDDLEEDREELFFKYLKELDSEVMSSISGVLPPKTKFRRLVEFLVEKRRIIKEKVEKAERND